MTRSSSSRRYTFPNAVETAGQNDYNANDPETTYHNFKMANQRMAAALKARGYHYRFEYALGARHNDGKVVAQTLPEALRWLWRGYPIP